MAHSDPPRIVSIHVGHPERYGQPGAADPMDRPWTTALFKRPVEGRVRVGLLNLEGDRQADLVHHGGADKAVLSYSAEHYPYWREELGRPDLGYGAFGENLTIAGLDEGTVCIGDIFEIGSAIIQVTEPRNPCWKLARRFRIKDFALRVQRADRAGWYARVLQEGYVEPGQPVRLVERLNPGWTISRCNEIRHRRKDDFEGAKAILALAGLGEYWQDVMSRRVRSGMPPDDQRRFWGPRPGDPDYAE